MRWIDLFAGAGLASEAARQAGCKVMAAVDYGYERPSKTIDRSPLFTYVANHGPHMVQQDIHTLSGEQFDALKPDGIMGGPPCQDFSIAGKRTGLEGYRGTLIFEFLRVAAESSASWVLMENVPGLLTSGGKEDIRAILAETQRLGFSPGWMEPGSFSPKHYHVFQAANYGTPQSRSRVFFLWNKHGWTASIPPPTHQKPISLASALGLDLRNAEPAPTIDAGGTRTGGWDLGQRSRRALGKIGFEGRLTVEQCAVLQGLAPDYRLVGTETSRYRQIGNGWAVQVGAAILSAIKAAHNKLSSI